LKFSLGYIALKVGGTVLGDSEIKISGVAEIQNAKVGSITFLSNSIYKRYLSTTKASAIFVSNEKLIKGRNGILVENPQLAIAKTLSIFFPEKIKSGVIHPSSVIHPSAQIGKNVTIEAGAIIETGVNIDDNVFIGANVFIGRNASIGAKCKIYQNVVVYSSSIIGDRSIIHGSAVIGCDGFGFVPGQSQNFKIPQTGRVVIGKDVEIGANSVIDRATIGETVIDNNTKIDNLVHVGHNVQIGEACLITAQVGIAGSTKLGANCQIGGQAGVVPHVELGPNSIIAAKSGVTKSLKGNQMYGGYPARPLREQHKRDAVYREVSLLKKKIEQLTQSSRKN
jgi:UDP-3-O-[3-hydroxymyristoyl] glucosamine N-acyltransferase